MLDKLAGCIIIQRGLVRFILDADLHKYGNIMIQQEKPSVHGIPVTGPFDFWLRLLAFQARQVGFESHMGHFESTTQWSE